MATYPLAAGLLTSPNDDPLTTPSIRRTLPTILTWFRNISIDPLANPSCKPLPALGHPFHHPPPPIPQSPSKTLLGLTPRLTHEGCLPPAAHAALPRRRPSPRPK